MSISVGNAKTDYGSLVLGIDAANTKSFTSTSVRNHGLAEWYCLVSNTVVSYAIPEPGTTLYKRDSTGTVTVVVSSSTVPLRGIISVIAGETYFGDGPIQLVAEDGSGGISIAPLSMAGTLFINYSNRGNPGIAYFYSPYGPATISFYDAAVTANGINGTVTSTLTLTKGQQGTIALPNLNWAYFKSTAPVLGATGMTGSDFTLLNPIETTMYNRYAGYVSTIIGTTPSTVGSYVTADSTYPVMNQTIADGSGGDTMQALGISYLSDTYTFGNSVSDYVIVAPYDNTVVNVSYWNGSSWTILETHTMTGGTTLAPIQVQRDGTAGVGVTATNISGGMAYFASGATGPWKWTSNNPVLVGINDTADDELPLLGWMSSANKTRASSLATGSPSLFSIGNLAGPANGLMLGDSYNAAANGVIYQDGVTGYISIPYRAANLVGETFTISAWINTRNTNNRYGVFSTRTDNTAGCWQLEIGSGSTTPTGADLGRVAVTGTGTWIFESNNSVLANNTWYHICWTKSSNSQQGGTMYVNGSAISSLQTTAYTILDNTSDMLIGAGTGRSQNLPGMIGNVELFNRELTASEVSALFKALRARYGI